ncbi:MAG TPA: hypothetical protein VE377_08200 [Candidatus Dormibacteraeota bacterium]|nr:hypothetical protein [Candidatus Dormibacteraeota bacterium]
MNDFEKIESYPEFRKAASDLAKEYRLHEGATTSLNYFWLAQDFAVIFLLSRDGADMRYVDLRSVPDPSMYFLGHFLVQRSRAKVEYPGPPERLKPSTLISAELAFFLGLLKGAPDVLQGNRKWLTQEYNLERVPVPPTWRTELQAFQRRLAVRPEGKM